MRPNCSSCNKAVTFGFKINEASEWVEGQISALKFWDFFFDSSDLSKAARLSIFGPNFEANSLSHHLTSRSIIPAPSSFIK